MTTNNPWTADVDRLTKAIIYDPTDDGTRNALDLCRKCARQWPNVDPYAAKWALLALETLNEKGLTQ